MNKEKYNEICVEKAKGNTEEMKKEHAETMTLKKILIIFCIIIISVAMAACSGSTSSYDDYGSDYDSDDSYENSDSYNSDDNDNSDEDSDSDDYNSSNDDDSYNENDTNDNLELVGGIENTKGVVEYGILTISGKVKNNSDKDYSSVIISFSVYDAENNKIGTCVDSISGLSAGETWAFKAGGIGENYYTYHLKSIKGY